RPFGEVKPPSPVGTAITGSRKTPTAPIASDRRSAWTFERSRWKGVASTARRGRLASRSGEPPYGSRYAASVAPPALVIRFASSSTLASPTSIALSSGSGPRGAAGPRLRTVFFVVFVAVVFFAGIAER